MGRLRTPHPNPPPIASRLELLEMFVHTGRLPWWADASSPDVVDETVDRLLREAPRRLGGWLHRLTTLTTREPLHRVVVHLGDERLAELVALLADRDVLTPSEITRGAEVLWEAGTRAASGIDAVRLRDVTWDAVLRTLVVEGIRDVDVFWRMVLARVAAETGVDLPRSGSLHPVGVVECRQAALAPAGRAERTERPPAGRPPAGRPPAGRAAGLRASPPRQGLKPPAYIRPSLRDEEVSPRDEGGHEAVRQPQRTASVDATSAPHPNPLPGPLPRASAGPEPGRGGRTADALGRTPPPAARTSPVEAPPDLAWSDADAAYVDNAGLVLLWPFLGHFFEHLDLLDDKAFVDDAARHRAVGLLQYLVTGDVAPPEYQVTLNKVLCGLEIETPFDLGPPISETEADECVELLRAVIGHAPILKNMSPEGFRGSFLVRPGVLSADGDAWLLRVERETWDVVIDRFPWSVSWIRAPWMEGAMSVEW